MGKRRRRRDAKGGGLAVCEGNVGNYLGEMGEISRVTDLGCMVEGSHEEWPHAAM